MAKSILGHLLLIAFLIPCASAQVINMSHDLVTLGIAAQNVTPNTPTLDARPLIQATATYAQNHSVKTLTLDKGNYYLLSATQGNAVLIFGGLSNMTVDFAGSTIYFQGPLLPNGIQLYQCTNFTLTNFNIDFITPPYTHAKITSVDTQNRILKYQVLPGWPDPSSFNSVTEPFGGPLLLWAAVFRNGNIVPGTTRTVLNGPITSGQLSLTQDGTPWTQSSTLATLQAGDTVVVTLRGSGPPILVWWCDSVTLSNINIYGASERAVSLHETSNSTVDTVRVEPRPVVGLIGGTGDGIHFDTTRQNDHVRNCYVTRTMDDGIAMDSQYAASVSNLVSPTELMVTRAGFERFPSGAAVNFVDPVSTLEFTGATISTENPADSTQPAYNGSVDVTFQQSLPSLAVGDGMVLADPSLRGQGSTIEDNIVEDTYGGRGIWVNGTIGVTVQRNVTRRTSMSGIMVSADTEAYPSPPAHDIVIQDNAIETAMAPAAVGTGTNAGMAAIEVLATNNQSFAFSTASSHSNITIVNNFIADSATSGIWVGELNGGSITNNLVARWYENPSLPIWGVPSQFVTQVEQDFSSPLVLHYDTGVTSSNNATDATSTVTTPVTLLSYNEMVSSLGATGSFSLTPAITGFGWNAISDSSWLTVTSPTPASGNSTVQYSVAANPTVAYRTGHIAVAGVTFTVVQSGADFLIQPTRPGRPSRPAASSALINRRTKSIRKTPRRLSSRGAQY